MQLRGARRRRAVDRGFVLSDHADWPGLQRAIAATGAAARDRDARLRGGDGALAGASRGCRPGRSSTEYGARTAASDAASPADASRAEPPARSGRSVALRRFAALYAELDATTATDRQGRCAEALLRRAPSRPMRPGRCTSWPVASRARWCPPACCGHWPASAPASTTGCSRSAIRRSATWPRPSPTCCRRRARAATWAWPSGSSSACCRLRDEPPEHAGGAHRRVLGRARRRPSRFLLTKLIGGGFRVGVSKLLVQRALAEHAGLDAKVVAQRMMGYTDKTARARCGALRAAGVARRRAGPADAGQPYPFFLAHPLDAGVDEFDATLGPPADWLVEWKYDGIRAQVVRRAGTGVDLVARRGAGDRPLPRGRGARAGAGPTARCSTARSWCGQPAATARRRSTCCSSASAARP